MSGTLEYRARIRDASTLANPDGTTDDLVVTSVSGGTNPYLIEPPTGDGQELDPVTGAVMSGTYRLMVADPLVSGTSRFVTQKLEDANRRQQLLSRRVYIEFRENGGAWQSLAAGYINALRLVNPITWQIDVGDTRRIERTKKLFERSTATFTKRGCIAGGPIIGGWGPVSDLGGWELQVTNVGTTYVTFKFLAGYQTPDFRRTSKLADLVDRVNTAATNYAKYREHWTISGGPVFVGTFDGLRVRLTDANGALLGGSTDEPGLFVPVAVIAGDGADLFTNGFPNFALTVQIGNGVTSPGTVGTKVRAAVYAVPVSETSPLYIVGHPVDIVRDCYADAGLTLDASSVTAAKNALGANLRVSLRLTESAEFDTFLRDALLGPFGLAVRVGLSGAYEIVTTRVKTTGVPAQTINTNDLRDGETQIFDLDEMTAITSITLETLSLSVAGYAAPGATRFAVKKDSWPLDGVLVAEDSVPVTSADYQTFGQRQVTYKIPGMVHDAASFTSNPSQLLTAIANEIFDRYGRGAIGGEIRVLRASGITAQPADELYLQPGHIPNQNKRYADDNSVGARIMQVIKRTETPDGPEFRLLDSGTNAQPVSPAVTISLAASATFPRRVAEFTITNAAAINATGVLQVAVEWATGGSSPAANGNSAARFDPGNVPAGAVALPAVAPGTKVWVRARTEQAGRRPSAWSAWTSVTLTAAAAPSGLSISAIRQNGATLSWTNGAATDPVAIYAYAGGSPPADWSPYLVAVLPAGSTTAKVRNLNGPSVTYQVAVAHLYADGSSSAKATGSFTTNSTLDSAPRPAGLQVISTSTQDASQRAGIALAVWASDPSCDIEIERAPDSGGSPGAFALVATVPGSTKVWIDDLPTDGAVRWYRIRHVLSGMTASAYTCSKSGTPTNLPQRLDQPDPVLPVINESASMTQGSVACSMTVTVSDPQCRVDFVEKRTKVDPGAWSGYTTVAGPSPYVATVNAPTGNAPGFGWIEMRVWGYDAQGNYGVLADFTEAFDANTIPSIAMLEGSFKDDGSLLIRVTADDDTASVYCTVSTSGYPSDGTLLGTSPVNGRNVEFTFAGPYAIGTVVYVSAKACGGLGGAGALSDTFQLRIVRGNDAASKTIRLPASAVIDVFDSATQTKDLSNTYYKCAAQQGNFGFIPVPKGATLTAVRIRTWAASRSISQDLAQLYVFRVDNDGTRTQLGSTQSSTVAGAWETLAVTSLSEDTSGNRSYLVEFGCQQGVGTGTSDYRCAWIEYDISVPNFNVTT